MKKTILYFCILLLAASCGKSVVEKPDNLIEEDKMVDIIYDLSVMEAIKSQAPIELENSHINPSTYVYKKYKIDSIQFAQSNKYYSSDLRNYKKMYEKVAKRLEDKKATTEKAIQKNGGQVPQPDPDAPQVQ
jgi:hypothetical protein